MQTRVLLDHGSGGMASQRLINDLFLRHFSNPILETLDDAASLELQGHVAMSTDTFTVDPLIFPGGDIGSLAVHGTVNDVAMVGGEPKYLSCGFVLEEGLELSLLERILGSMAQAVDRAGVSIVTGDTKVVPKGALDKMFINTTGLGPITVDKPPSGARAADGDAVLISGTVGDHGLTIMSSREGIQFDTEVRSDSAALNDMIGRLLRELPEVHVLRDPTRGGLATTLNEIAVQSGKQVQISEASVPVKPSVSEGCSFLGLDPLYLANEGKVLCILPQAHAEQALQIMRHDPAGREASWIGSVDSGRAGRVVLTTRIGGQRLLTMLEGEPLPRIC